MTQIFALARLSLAALAARPLLGLSLGFGSGIVLGLLHFGSLWWTTRLYAGSAALRGLGVQLLRFGLLTLALTALAGLGAGPLLAGALGLLLGRGLLLHRAQRAA